MSQELFSGHGWRITLDTDPLPDGRQKTSARVHRCDTVHILALNDEGKLLLLREYRPHLHRYVWMLPSGKVDKETDLLIAAQRELQEETGFRAAVLEPYFSCYYSEALVTTAHYFRARGLTHAPLPQDDYELIEVHPLTLEEALERVLDNERVHAVSALGILKLLKDDFHK
jgi:ADP-ribose pyrophosphatase